MPARRVARDVDVTMLPDGGRGQQWLLIVSTGLVALRAVLLGASVFAPHLVAFTEMESYRMDGVPPLYAAHNDCGGDILLGWRIGERVRIEGSDTVYTVVEERHTPKWSHVEKLVGMAGDIVLQTCYYGENRMRFLGLAPQ